MSKKVVILRGVPGSGKSSFAGRLSDVTVVSADFFFMGRKGYVFIPEELPNAHQECLHCFLGALLEGQDKVVVDNTNLYAHEISPYYRLAEVFGCEVEIITIKADYAIALARNVHGVPPETHARMAATLEREKLPPWWNHREFQSSSLEAIQEEGRRVLS